MDTQDPGLALEASAPVEGEDKFDKLLEERFAPAHRGEMAREIANFDRLRIPDRFDLEHVRRKLRFHGLIPSKVQSALKDWVPDLLAHAAQSGLRLRDLNHEIHFYDLPAFEESMGPVPKGVKLPASSHQFNQLYRIYTVRVVLPEKIESVSLLLTVLRAVLARMLGDVFLTEEIFSLEAYREDVEEQDATPTAGMGEKIRVLAESTFTTPLLNEELVTYGKQIGLSIKRSTAQVRKAYFQEMEKQLEAQKLPEQQGQLVERVFDVFMQALEEDTAGEIGRLVQEVEKLNGQLSFLPPDDLPEYARLKTANPTHYLRSAHLRLGFLLEVIGAFGDLHADMENPDTGLSPIVEEALDGYLARMRTENLARPYLIADAQLSDELARKKAAFPFEVHDLLARMPKSDNPDRAFKSLSRRITNSIYQRLYTALLIIDIWSRHRDQGKEEAFRASERFQSLKGLLANFNFRRPLLEALYIKVGVLLDFAEGRAGQQKQGRRFPLEAFRQAWSHLIPHVLIAGYFSAKGGVKGFDPAHYWQSVEDSLRRQVAAEAGPHHLAYCLRQIHALAGAEGTAVLLDLLRNPVGTFRFAVNQALAPPPEKQSVPEERAAHLEKLARVVMDARKESLKHAIVPGTKA